MKYFAMLLGLFSSAILSAPNVLSPPKYALPHTFLLLLSFLQLRSGVPPLRETEFLDTKVGIFREEMSLCQENGAGFHESSRSR